MKAIWLGVLVYAGVEAIAAAGRVWQKRQRAKAALASGSELNQPALQQLPAAPSPLAALPEAHRAESGADRVKPDSEPRPRSVAPSANLLAEPDLLQLTGDLDLPLAVSVSVTDLVQAEQPATTSTLDLDLVPPELAIPEVESAKSDRSPASLPEQPSSHQSVLAEIAALGEANTDAVSHFQRYLDHPDDIVRAATVFELGELAAKRSGAEATEILHLLMPLNQDPALQVRSQVVAALAKIQAVIS